MQPNQISSGPRHFVLAGMPRAGTTYLYHAFASHPDAFVPYRKELRFFSTNYHRGEDWYQRFFSQAAPGLVRVDASPDYFMDGDAPTRIRDFSSDIKVVLAVRDPAVWSVSLHRQLGTIERSVSPFSDFLVKADYPDFTFPWPRRKPKLQFSLHSGFIQSQIAAFRDALGPRLLLYDFALFERDPLTVMQALESFLGIKAFFSTDNLPGGRINARERKNNRWLSYLSSRDALINIAGSIIPRKTLVVLRLKMDRASSLDKGAMPSPVDATDLAIARSTLASDVTYVKSIFASSPLMLGNNQPFR